MDSLAVMGVIKMDLISKIIQEGGEPIVIYELGTNAEPVSNPKRIGMLSLTSSSNPRKYQINYLGSLGFSTLSEISAFPELESIVYELAADNQIMKTYVVGVNGNPLVMGSFNEDDEAVAFSLLSIGSRIANETRKTKMNYLGNIEFRKYEDFLRLYSTKKSTADKFATAMEFMKKRLAKIEEERRKNA